VISRLHEASLRLWFWPSDLVRAWKYSPKARHARRLQSFYCRHCNRTSYKSKDVENRYCGYCHHFCDDVEDPVYEIM